MDTKDKETLKEFRKMLVSSDSNDDEMLVLSDSNDDKKLREERFLFEKSFFCLEKIYGGRCTNQENKKGEIALSICTESKINWTNEIMYVYGDFKLFQFKINIKGWIDNMLKKTDKIYFVLINLSIHDLENCLLIANGKVFYMFEDTMFKMQQDSSINLEKDPLLDKNKIKNKKIDRPNIISYLIYLFIINEKNLVNEETSGSTGTTDLGSITREDIIDYLLTRIEEEDNKSIENFLDFTDKFIDKYYPVIFDIKTNYDFAPLLNLTDLPADT